MTLLLSATPKPCEKCFVFSAISTDYRKFRARNLYIVTFQKTARRRIIRLILLFCNVTSHLLCV